MDNVYSIISKLDFWAQQIQKYRKQIQHFLEYLSFLLIQNQYCKSGDVLNFLYNFYVLLYLDNNEISFKHLQTLKLFCGVTPLFGVPAGLNPAGLTGVPVVFAATGGGGLVGDNFGELPGSTFLI